MSSVLFLLALAWVLSPWFATKAGYTIGGAR